MLRTRRACGGFVLLRTLRFRGDAPRGALDTSRAATSKISFHFFAAPPQTPPPLGERNCKEIFGLLATRPFKKLHSNLHLLESFSFRFFTVWWRPRRFARSSAMTYSNHAHKPASTSHRHARIRSRRLLGAGGCSLELDISVKSKFLLIMDFEPCLSCY